jgi:hypothetical protein
MNSLSLIQLSFRYICHASSTMINGFIKRPTIRAFYLTYMNFACCLSVISKNSSLRA